MSKARQSTLRTGLVHMALIAYALVALFPVFLTIINSFKSKQAIFGQPLRLPSPSTFSLIGYETVLKQGDFVTYFQAGTLWAQRPGEPIDPDNACGLRVGVQSTTVEDTDEIPAKSAACVKAGARTVSAFSP